MIINTIQSIHNNALAGVDYGSPRQYQLVIPAGSSSTTATVTILDDHISEPTEEFKLTIEPEEVVQLISPAETVIIIMDDDCELFFVYGVHLRLCSSYSLMNA